MKISKNANKDKERYPIRVVMNNGQTVYIPQQKKFGSYCSSHGCSITAVSIALQCLGRKQASDGSILNPKEMYQKCKKWFSGYNGSKLTIYGCARAINKCVSDSAEWHSSTSSNKSKMETKIRSALNSGNIVLFEEKNPIHTVALLGFDSKGRVIVATNGRIDRRSLKTQMSYRLTGKSGKDNQKTWWGGRDHGAGYVIVKCENAKTPTVKKSQSSVKTISDNGLNLIKKWEGRYLKAYQDCVGVWTIGYGMIDSDYKYTGLHVKKGVTITDKQCDELFVKLIKGKYCPLVDKYMSKYHFNQNQYDALVSFAYNIGNIDQLTANGTRTIKQISEKIPAYCKAGGKTVKGLLDRRKDEQKLFNK